MQQDWIRIAMTDLADKTILITGAGGGFGRQMVLQFRAAGAQLILTDINDQLLRVVPDILVNNAGLAVAGRLDHVPPERWESLMQLNLLAPMRLTDQFLPGMIERGSGHIVNISSIAGWVGAEGLSAYCAAKFGLRGFGMSLAADLRGTGVQVTNVYPCFSRTPILDSPQYGFDERRSAPEFLISDPAKVVARVVDGVRRNRLNVFPDNYARLIHYLSRFAPRLLRTLDRRIQAHSIGAGEAPD